MRISLTDIRQTERYLQGQLPPDEQLVFSARLLTDPLLRLNVRLQQRTLQLLQLYHRRELKREAENAHERLFQDPEKKDFREQIWMLF